MVTHMSFMTSDPQYTLAVPTPLYSISPSKIFRQNIPSLSCKSNVPFKSTSSLLPPPIKNIMNQPFEAPSKMSMKLSQTSHYPSPPAFSSKDKFGMHSPAFSTLNDKENIAPNNLKSSKGYPRQDSQESSKNSVGMPLQTLVIPEPHEMPVIEDDGQKPPYSYATLIGMAILRAPQRRLTLSAIYHWISQTFEYYCNNDSGWQNSIRHNLSLNKAFVKQERPKDQPGKGNYWTIEPGYEFQFMKGRTRKNTSAGSKRPTVASSLTIPHTDKKRSLMEDVIESNHQASTYVKRSKNEHSVIEASSLPCQPIEITPPLTQEETDLLCNKNNDCYNTLPSCQTAFSKHMSLQNHFENHTTSNILNLVSPPMSPHQDPMVNSMPYSPLTPIPIAPTMIPSNSSPRTCLRKHRDHIIQLLQTPENSQAFVEEDLWENGNTNGSAQNSNTLVFEDEDVASKACFGSPDKREAKRREIRRSLVSGLYGKELFAINGVSEVIDVFGIDIVSVVRREIERIRQNGDSTVSDSSTLKECLTCDF